MDRGRSRVGWWWPAAALMLALPGLATAAETHDAQKKDIFDPAQIGLGIWTVVVFVVLLLVLKRFAWGPMLEALHRREDAIRSAAEEARVARADMERLRADFEARMAEANAQIPRMIEQARRDAERVAAELRGKAQADIQTERQRLSREIDVRRDQALQELTNHTAHLATLISAKVLRRSVSEEDHRRLVDEALGELRQAPTEARRRAEAGV